MMRIKHFLSKHIILAGIVLILALGILWFWSNHNYLESNTPTALYSGAFTHNHEHIIVSGHGTTIYVYAITTGKLAQTLQLSSTAILDLSMHPTENLMAVNHNFVQPANDDLRLVSLMDLQGHTVHNFTCYAASGYIDSVAWSTSGDMLAIGYGDGSVCVWDRQTFELLYRIQIPNSSTRSTRNTGILYFQTITPY